MEHENRLVDMLEPCPCEKQHLENPRQRHEILQRSAERKLKIATVSHGSQRHPLENQQDSSRHLLAHLTGELSACCHLALFLHIRFFGRIKGRWKGQLEAMTVVMTHFRTLVVSPMWRDWVSEKEASISSYRYLTVAACDGESA